MDNNGGEANVPVLIVGGGSAGLSLAAELGYRGVHCMLVESNDEPNAHPRASNAGPRAMEHFRRWGIADKVIAAGVPSDFPLDVVFTSRLDRYEIRRLGFPTTGECLDSACDPQPIIKDLKWSPYFKIQIGQNILEPIIRSYAESRASVDLRFGWRLDDFEVDGDAITAVIVRNSDGYRMTVRARFLAGCDGARSMVRGKMGVSFEGRGVLARNQSIFFRSSHFAEAYGRRLGRLIWTLAPDTRGVFIAIDGREHWTYNRYFAQLGEKLDESAIWRAMGHEFPLDVISVQAWSGYQLVAPHYRNGPLFLAGDAAHLFHPTGGFGMNTSIGDAVDLGWKLAAVVQGWGGAGLLDAYDAERRPVAVRNSLEAAGNFDRLSENLMQLPEGLETDGAEGERIRGEANDSLNSQVRTWTAGGMHLGYTYDASPIVIGDGTPPPNHDPQNYMPSARPGSRAPHLWIEDGRSTLDLFGPGFTLVVLGAEVPDPTAFVAAAERKRVPFCVVRLTEPGAVAAFGAPLVLVRPDGHVAWRGDATPTDAGAILDRVCGAAMHANNLSQVDDHRQVAR